MAAVVTGSITDSLSDCVARPGQPIKPTHPIFIESTPEHPIAGVPPAEDNSAEPSHRAATGRRSLARASDPRRSARASITEQSGPSAIVIPPGQPGFVPSHPIEITANCPAIRRIHYRSRCQARLRADLSGSQPDCHPIQHAARSHQPQPDQWSLVARSAGGKRRAAEVTEVTPRERKDLPWILALFAAVLVVSLVVGCGGCARSDFPYRFRGPHLLRDALLGKSGRRSVV